MSTFVRALNQSAALCILVIILGGGLQSCSKHRVNNNKFYFQAEFDGELVTLKDKCQGYEAGVGQSESYAQGNVATRQESNMIALVNNSDQPYVFWSLGAHFPFDPVNNDDILDMYAPGSYHYTDGQGETHAPTAAIAWIDDNGNEWATYNGSGDQSGSSFRVVDTEAADDEDYVGMCQIEFTCKLYDKNGNMMQVTDGKARGPFGIAE